MPSRLLIIDIEASSFDGYPIEIGFAEVDLETEKIDVSARLIAPPRAWLKTLPWSYESEKIHGLSLEYLRENGDPVEEVATWAAHMIGDRRTWTDALELDSRWLNLLLAYAPERPTGRLQSFSGKDLLPDFVVTSIANDAQEMGLREHRAGDDAHHLALLALARHRLGADFS